ncbi:hypothetical protein LF1_18650 [Rubripirellula obstinata]|uniref:Uncharacterized protein n=1 Tax=Rubripirellula obstinata TaxID=406547 RepID=A0A5B1CIS3_9BACT|nr:hypothetical protein [Rubripirellula obstinata]KAA1259333.1 hypothetical protein LF1_18650 [Rubripirellula obstinata]
MNTVERLLALFADAIDKQAVFKQDRVNFEQDTRDYVLRSIWENSRDAFYEAVRLAIDAADIASFEPSFRGRILTIVRSLQRAELNPGTEDMLAIYRAVEPELTASSEALDKDVLAEKYEVRRQAKRGDSIKVSPKIESSLRLSNGKQNELDREAFVTSDDEYKTVQWGKHRFFEQFTPQGARVLKVIAESKNGTTLKDIRRVERDLRTVSQAFRRTSAKLRREKLTHHAFHTMIVYDGERWQIADPKNFDFSEWCSSGVVEVV